MKQATLFDDVPKGEGHLAVFPTAVNLGTLYAPALAAVQRAATIHADAPALEVEELQEIADAKADAREYLRLLRVSGHGSLAETWQGILDAPDYPSRK